MNKRIIFAACFLSLFLASSSGAAGTKWAELVERAAERGDYGSALDYLRRLEVREPDNPSLREARIGLLKALGNQYYRKGDFRRARETYLEALDIAPENFGVLRMLGEIAYFSQRLEDAATYWNEALALQPGDRELARLLKKLNNESAVEAELDASSLANFDIRYTSRSEAYHIKEIENWLMEAYREIGYDFNYYPPTPVVVLLYTREEFARIRRTPSWVGALYDGKVRLPVSGDDLSPRDIKKILWHEYTHAVINARTGNNCPRWLHEGLAQYQEAKVDPVDLPDLGQELDRGRLIPLGELDRAFAFDQSVGRVRLAYAQAYSLVGYLINRYGFWRINAILEELGKGKGWRAVFENEFLFPVSDLEEEWQGKI
ncbi:MAG: peptidase MA family metallohydrolase [Candidatus Erginobacter occultus]|nr:peptidase MA family metallohydrolase [Candidatus Erginobacter occultus]